MRVMQLFPLGLHSHGMRATHLFARQVLHGCCKNNCAGRFLVDNRRCCTTLAKVRCLQTQTCEELEQSKVALLEIHWREDSPVQPLVEKDGLRVCAVQWAERLH